jgi:hypothetical protein
MAKIPRHLVIAQKHVRLPSGDGPDVRPRLRIVGDPWKFGGADRGGFGLGDDEHPKSIGDAHHGWQARCSPTIWETGHYHIYMDGSGHSHNHCSLVHREKSI